MRAALWGIPGGRRLRLAAGLCAGAVCLAACSSNVNDNPAIGGGNTGTGQTADVTMQALNSGQSGTATLLESPSLVLTVKIDLTAAPATIQEPAGIHAGTCTAIGPTVAFALSSVISGSSTSINLNTTLAELSSSPYVIVVQRSGVDSTPVSCGPIPEAAAATP
jgi:hypothetical protein